MHHSDANDQSTGPFESVSQTPWQGPEEELYQEKRPPEEEPYQEKRQPHQPMDGPEAEFYQSLRGDPVQTAWRESPPLWNTSGKLSIPPSAKQPARGSRSVAMLALTMVIASVFGVGLFAGWTFSRGAGILLGTNSLLTVPSLTGNTIEAAREAAIAKVKPSVVQVNVTGMTRRGEYIQHASGVVVDNRGYIVTNNHVVQQGESIKVVFADGNTIENVQVAGTDSVDDLAVLRIDPPANMVVATLGDSSKLQVGEDVMAIGNPLGVSETATHGIVSALNRSMLERHGPMIPNTIQTDTPINLGNGGGALADLQGNVIGIPTLIAIDPRFGSPANGMGFAIPINQVKLIVPQIIQDGSVTHTGRAALNINSEDINAYLQASDNLSVDHGVYVTDIESDGPAGLQVGDVIVGMNSKPIDNEASLADLLATKVPGDKVSVRVYRGDQPMTFNVTLGELPAGDD
ncbi:MAG TPA: trypsin-like peptidase domain-containing protein [Ktedonobacteraceae bacterium]|nr:trypsin-like peptidase domain-containing protein [Ktedonobacteraceae bacterium]